MQSQHLLFSVLRGGEGWRCYNEGGPNRRRLQRADFFLSYWVVAEWCLPLSPSGGARGIRLPVTLLHASYCQEPSLTSLVAQPRLGFTG